MTRIEPKHPIEIAELTNVFPEYKKIIVFGSGYGQRLSLLNKIDGIKAHGIEINKRRIKESFDKNVSKKFPKGEWDLFLSYDVFEHLTNKEIREVFDKCKKAKIKKMVLTITSCDNPNFFCDESHINPKTNLQWLYFLERCGLKRTHSKLKLLHPFVIVGELK